MIVRSADREKLYPQLQLGVLGVPSRADLGLPASHRVFQLLIEDMQVDLGGRQVCAPRGLLHARMNRMLDFDTIDDWEPTLTSVLSPLLPDSFEQRLLDAELQCVENACEFLFEQPCLDLVVDETLTWLKSSKIAGYHGTRLDDAELTSVQTHGLLPLDARSRRDRLAAVLSPHPEWSKVQARLDEAILSYGPMAVAGRREGQVHLALSRSDVASDGYRRILSNGSEFDQCVAGSLLGQEGMRLLAQYGEYRVLRFSIPGHLAVDAASPFFGIEWERAQGNIPSLISHFLSSWCFRQAHPGATIQARHCSMMFKVPVPPDWMEGFETLSTSSLACSSSSGAAGEG